MVLATVQYIWELLNELIKSFLQIDTIFYIGVGFLLLMTAFIFIRSTFSYESRLSRSVNKLNIWLLKNRTINEQNLVEFNRLIKSKKCPKILRKHWQQYMLYRDKLPSEYISTYNCIDKPGKTSGFVSNIKNYISIYKLTALITFFFSLISYSGKSDSSLIYYISMTLVGPAIILLLGVIFTLILRSYQNHSIADLYQTFHIFTRYVDKASVTIPKYVDFEILFTQQEIRDGIPILGEYLEKRARQEQEELEEAQRNAVAHEEYNFADSGVDGSLMLERAMKESETFLNAKQRIYAEIQQFESEISTLKKNYENTSKDYQRKLQASKENMERLRQQQEESTNRIEVNYIRKQQQDEVKKQEQLEKDQEDATIKFNAEINSLNEEIEKRKQDLESKKIRVQEAMESEYQSFSVKLHKTISNEVEKESEANIQRINNEKDQYAQAITYLKGEVDNKDQIIVAKDQIISELTARLQLLKTSGASDVELQELNQTSTLENEEITETATQEEQTSSEESSDGHYDDNGYYWFNDGTYYDNQGLYHDLEGNVYDSDGNLQAKNMPVETEKTEEIAQPLSQKVEQEIQLEAEPIIEENQISEEPNVVQEEQNEVNLNEEVAPDEQLNEVAPTGYDEQGNYRYANGTYYDLDNLYHDVDGKVYNTEGTLVEAQEKQEVAEENQPEQQSDEISNEEAQVEVKTEESPVEEPASVNILENEVSDINIEESQENDDVDFFNLDNKEEAPTVEEMPTETKSAVEEKIEQNNAENLAAENETTDKEESAPKRKAGRPRKEKSEDEENKPKRSVGRPKKEKSEDEENKPKRSVGRPKKEKSEDEENKPKRSVGRPKKEKSEDEENKPKRSVGRPKKQKTEEEQSTEILKHLGQSLLDLSEQKSKKRKLQKKSDD